MNNEQAAVQSLAAQHAGQKVILDENAIILGRDAEACKIVYGEGTPGISRKHCALTWDAEKQCFVLMDLDPSYGTFLEDGTRLEPRKPYRLQPGARFYLAERANMVLLASGETEKQKSTAAHEEPAEGSSWKNTVSAKNC